MTYPQSLKQHFINKKLSIQEVVFFGIVIMALGGGLMAIMACTLIVTVK